jgi:hypothetical protein
MDIAVTSQHSRDNIFNRLQCLKAACAESISNLKAQEPNKRVALVTFSDAIKYYGDATKIENNQPLVGIGNGCRRIFKDIDADILVNKEKMLSLGSSQDGDLKPIKITEVSLINRIKQLRTQGSTALGPSLVFSIGLASKKPGSQIILCTDGCANVGMGSIEEKTPHLAETFYDEIADYAKSKGVSVSVITMEGTDCKLSLLGRVADRTNGELNIVNPHNLAEQFKAILDNRIVATNVTVKLMVSKFLYIRDEEFEMAEMKAVEGGDAQAKENLNKLKKSVAIRDIGNVHLDTEITFEYGIRKLSEEEKKSAPRLAQAPFQLQISYTAPDGSRAMRVFTKFHEFTRDRQRAEASIQSRSLIFANVAQKMSNHALQSNVRFAKYRQRQMDRMTRDNHWPSPVLFQKQSGRVMSINNSQNARDLDDQAANDLIRTKKSSSRSFKTY